LTFFVSTFQLIVFVYGGEMFHYVEFALFFHCSRPIFS